MILTGLPVVNMPYMPAALMPIPCCPRLIRKRWNLDPYSSLPKINGICFFMIPGPLSWIATRNRFGLRLLDMDPDLRHDPRLFAGVQRVVDRLLDGGQQRLARIVKPQQVPVLGKKLADRNVALLLGHRFGRHATTWPAVGRSRLRGRVRPVYRSLLFHQALLGLSATSASRGCAGVFLRRTFFFTFAAANAWYSLTWNDSVQGRTGPTQGRSPPRSGRGARGGVGCGFERSDYSGWRNRLPACLACQRGARCLFRTMQELRFTRQPPLTEKTYWWIRWRIPVHQWHTRGVSSTPPSGPHPRPALRREHPTGPSPGGPSRALRIGRNPRIKEEPFDASDFWKDDLARRRFVSHRLPEPHRGPRAGAAGTGRGSRTAARSRAAARGRPDRNHERLPRWQLPDGRGGRCRMHAGRIRAELPATRTTDSPSCSTATTCPVRAAVCPPTCTWLPNQYPPGLATPTTLTSP